MAAHWQPVGEAACRPAVNNVGGAPPADTAATREHLIVMYMPRSHACMLAVGVPPWQLDGNVYRNGRAMNAVDGVHCI